MGKYSPEERIQIFNALISKANKVLNNRPISSDDKRKFKIYTQNVLEKIFGKKSEEVNTILDESGFFVMIGGQGEEYYENERAEELQSIIYNLESYIEIAENDKSFQSKNIEIGKKSKSNKVFLVHGHNEEILEKTARFLEKVEIQYIILKEEPNNGRTIIEKFEECSLEASFAIIMLTDDDISGSKSSDSIDYCPRARQNVILELGYFYGKLGRNNVCAIYKPSVELPSDIYGILYVELDGKISWQYSVAKELKNAGFEVDLNKI